MGGDESQRPCGEIEVDDERDSLFWKNADRIWQLGLST